MKICVADVDWHRHEMKSFFEPAVNDLLAKVQEQKDELASKGSKIDVSTYIE